MFKLRKSKDKIDIELVGDFTPNPVSIQDYAQYVKTEEEKQLKNAIIKFLETIIVPIPYEPLIGSYSITINNAYATARKDLADYLIKNMETE